MLLKTLLFLLFDLTVFADVGNPIRLSLETLKTGDKIIIAGVTNRIHQPAIELHIFDHGLDQSAEYYDHPMALSILIDGENYVYMLGYGYDTDHRTVLKNISGFHITRGEPFRIAVGMRDGNTIRFELNEKPPIDVTVDMKESQVVEISGAIETLSTFQIDHSARLPILREVNLRTGRFMAVTFSTKSYGSLNIYFQNDQNFISLWILVDVATRIISFTSLLENQDNVPESVSNTIYPNKVHALTVVNEVACVKIILDGRGIYCYRHRVRRPYLEYKQLYVEPGTAFIENIVEGEI